MKFRFHLLIFLTYGLMAVFFTFPLIVKATEFIPMPSYLSSTALDSRPLGNPLGVLASEAFPSYFS